MEEGWSLLGVALGFILGMALILAPDSIVIVDGSIETGAYVEYKDVVYKLVEVE